MLGISQGYDAVEGEQLRFVSLADCRYHIFEYEREAYPPRLSQRTMWIGSVRNIPTLAVGPICQRLESILDHTSANAIHIQLRCEGVGYRSVFGILDMLHLRRQLQRPFSQVLTSVLILYHNPGTT